MLFAADLSDLNNGVNVVEVKKEEADGDVVDVGVSVKREIEDEGDGTLLNEKKVRLTKRSAVTGNRSAKTLKTETSITVKS